MVGFCDVSNTIAGMITNKNRNGNFFMRMGFPAKIINVQFLFLTQ
jgi:hypothetical protein